MASDRTPLPPVEAEFIEVTARPVAPTKCACPYCPDAVSGAAWCSACAVACATTLARIHRGLAVAAPAVQQGRERGQEIAQGIRAASRTVSDVLDAYGALTGRPRRRRR